MIKVYLYDNSFSVSPKKDYRLAENFNITHINIRPNEVSIVGQLQLPKGETQTKVYLFQQENPSFKMVDLEK